MRQFDVYANRNRSTRQAYPYLVDIQSEVIAVLDTRLVAPLARRAGVKELSLSRLTPEITYRGEALLLLVPLLASIPKTALADPLGSVRHLRGEIIAALDFAVTGV